MLKMAGSRNKTELGVTFSRVCDFHFDRSKTYSIDLTDPATIKMYRRDNGRLAYYARATNGTPARSAAAINRSRWDIYRVAA